MSTKKTHSAGAKELKGQPAKGKQAPPSGANGGQGRAAGKGGNGSAKYPFAAGRYIITASRKRATSATAATDNQIWIRAAGSVTLVTLPHTLAANETIVCYDPTKVAAPGGGATKKGKKKGGSKTEAEPDVDYFCVDYDDGTTVVEDVIDYDYSNDSIEIDLSVLDGFEELYGEEAGTSYKCTTGEEGSEQSIGIEG